VRRLCPLLLAAPALYVAGLAAAYAAMPGMSPLQPPPLTGGVALGFDICVYLAMAGSGMAEGVGARRWATLWFLAALGIRLMVVG